MEAKKYEIEDLKKILCFVIEAGNVADQIKTKKTWIEKATAVLPLTDEFISMFTVNYKEVPKQFSDIDEKEKEELLAMAKEKYDIADDAKEALVEEGLAVVARLAEIIDGVVDYAKKWKN